MVVYHKLNFDRNSVISTQSPHFCSDPLQNAQPLGGTEELLGGLHARIVPTGNPKTKMMTSFSLRYPLYKKAVPTGNTKTTRPKVY